MDTRQRFDWSLIDFAKVSSNGDSYQECPVCGKDRKKRNTKSLSVNLQKGVANCHHCEAYSVNPNNDNKTAIITPKTYTKPDISKYSDVSDKVLEWFKNERGILDNTLYHFKIKSAVKYFVQANAERNCIVFPFYIGDEVIYSKYRSGDKMFMADKNCRLIMFNLNEIRDAKEVCIVEGEIDCMAVWQSGYRTVVSVPSGALSLTKEEKEHFDRTGTLPQSGEAANLEYIDNSWDYIKDVEKWIIAVDNDAAGYKLKQELIRRFGAESCKIADFGDCKDANDYLLKYKEAALFECISQAKEMPLEHVLEYEDAMGYLDDIYRNGYKMGNETPMPSFNDHYKPRLGELDMWYGSANHGKSWALIWYCTMCSCLYGWKWSMYLPENSPAAEVYRIITEIITGKSYRKTARNRIKPSEIEACRHFIGKHFFVIDYSDSDNIPCMDDLMGNFRQLVKRKGIHGCVVDPLNDLQHKKSGLRDDEYYQEMLSKVRKFKQKFNLKFIISAHPTTMADRETEDHSVQGKRAKVINAADLSGGSIFKNRADNCISIYRNLFEENYRLITEVHVQKVKWQEAVGTPTNKYQPIEMKYNPETKRYFVDGRDPLENWFIDNLYKEHAGQEQAVVDFSNRLDKNIDKTWEETLNGFEDECEVPF